MVKVDVMKLLAKTYKFHRTKLDLYEEGVCNLTTREYEDALKICGKIEFVIDKFVDNEKIILINDILKNKFRLCEDEYFSLASYYRIRKIAYDKFYNYII